ncbi:restriction endonuclease [Amycolatopsis sp. H6(2020)]|nr:restriction endonuclease [Amycolatopsis sp. H6(2020)]
MAAWDDYQEEVASFFRGLGLDAATNVPISGVRTSHDIDVVVRSEHVGFDMLWVVECKRWSKPVSKLHVLALREIVSDVGADRGLLMAESGFQSGAHEAADLTNVKLTSLVELKDSASYSLGMASLRALQDRVDGCRSRYWELEKESRIDCGLRPPVGLPGYSGNLVIEATEAALNDAFKGKFPPLLDGLAPLLYGHFRFSAGSPSGLYEEIEPLIAELEELLDRAYASPGRKLKRDRTN